MSTLLNRKLLQTAVAVTVIGLGLTACQPSSTGNGSTASAGATASASATAMGGTTGADGGKPGGGTAQPGTLRAMPAGSVTLRQSGPGMLEASIDLFGLTPGSSHLAAIEAPGGNVLAPAVRFGSFTADTAGRVHTTLSAQQSGSLPTGSRFGVHLGTFGGDANRNPVAMELIAQTDPLPGRLDTGHTLPFHAVSFDAAGNSLGTLSGTQKTVYDPAAHTLSVTLTAHGLTPGAHAAHIHLGSCQDQGGVKYMLADFQADSHGDIADQTRVVTGVTSAPPAGGWYLNLHQGDMNSILSNGAPALAFRPLLCADLGPVPAATGAHGTPMPSMSSASSMPSMRSMPSMQSAPSTKSTQSMSATEPEASMSPAPRTSPSAEAGTTAPGTDAMAGMSGNHPSAAGQ